MTFGNMRIEFTVGEPGSVIMDVKARVTTKHDLDKLTEAINASRPLLRDTDGSPEGPDAKQLDGEAATAGAEGIAKEPTS